MQKTIDFVTRTLIVGLWLVIPVGILGFWLTGGGAICDNKGPSCSDYLLPAFFISPFIVSLLIQIIQFYFVKKINSQILLKINGILVLVFSLPIAAFFGFIIYIVSSFQRVNNPVVYGIGFGTPIFLWLIHDGICKIKNSKSFSNSQDLSHE